MQTAETKNEQLEHFIEESLARMNKKLNKVLNLFQDTILYSSKTYYQEEIYKRDKTNKQLLDRVTQLQRKHKLLRDYRVLANQITLDENEPSNDEMSSSDRERIKKEEIIENLKQLNLLSPQSNTSQPVSDPEEVRIKALQMGSNIISYAFGQ